MAPAALPVELLRDTAEFLRDVDTGSSPPWLNDEKPYRSDELKNLSLTPQSHRSIAHPLLFVDTRSHNAFAWYLGHE